MQVEGGWYLIDTWYKENVIYKILTNVYTHTQVKIKFHTNI